MPGVEISSGSLGHGLPLAVGTALGLRAQGIAARVVVLVGDAELDEGSNHEAMELAAALGLAALTVVVIDNRSSSYAVPGRIEQRFAVEGWHAVTVDGRDHDLLEKALSHREFDRPNVVVAVVEEKCMNPRSPVRPHRRRPRRHRRLASRSCTPRSPASTSARSRPAIPTGSSTSASASSCWSASARAWR